MKSDLPASVSVAGKEDYLSTRGRDDADSGNADTGAGTQSGEARLEIIRWYGVDSGAWNQILFVLPLVSATLDA